MTHVKLDKNQYHLQSIVVKPLEKEGVHISTRCVFSLNDNGFFTIQTNPKHEPEATRQLIDLLRRPFQSLQNDIPIIDMVDIVSVLKKHIRFYTIKEENLTPYEQQPIQGTYVKVHVPSVTLSLYSYYFLSNNDFQVTSDLFSNGDDHHVTLTAHGTEGKKIKGVFILNAPLEPKEIEQAVADFTQILVALSQMGYIRLSIIKGVFENHYNVRGLRRLKVYFDH